MSEYRVTYKIECEADDPVEAAARTQGILQDPENTAWAFEVDRHDEKWVNVDLDLLSYCPDCHMAMWIDVDEKNWMCSCGKTITFAEQFNKLNK